MSNNGFEVLAVMKDRNAVFYNVTPFSLVLYVFTTAQCRKLPPRKLETETVTK
jgi:hypothetical protein